MIRINRISIMSNMCYDPPPLPSELDSFGVAVPPPFRLLAPSTVSVLVMCTAPSSVMLGALIVQSPLQVSVAVWQEMLSGPALVKVKVDPASAYSITVPSAKVIWRLLGSNIGGGLPVL